MEFLDREAWLQRCPSFCRSSVAGAPIAYLAEVQVGGRLESVATVSHEVDRADLDAALRRLHDHVSNELERGWNDPVQPSHLVFTRTLSWPAECGFVIPDGALWGVPYVNSATMYGFIKQDVEGFALQG